MFLAILLAVTWAFVNQRVLSSPLGPLPMIIFSASLAVVSAFSTRDRILAPLTCFLAVVAATAYVVNHRGMPYAQITTYVPVAAVSSIPAMVVAFAMHWFMNERQNKESAGSSKTPA